MKTVLEVEKTTRTGTSNASKRPGRLQPLDNRPNSQAQKGGKAKKAEGSEDYDI